MSLAGVAAGFAGRPAIHRTRDISPEICVGLPLGLIVVIGVLAIAVPAGPMYDLVLRSEFGVIEILTVLFCIAGSILAFSTARRVSALPYSLLFRWYLYLFALGFVLLAGEEVSWGQHVFGWGPVAGFEKETNLHNLTIQTEQIPKVILHAAAILGGLIWPLMGVKRWSNAPDWVHWLMPTIVVAPTILIALIVRLVERVLVWFDFEPVYSNLENFKELKEANELFLVYFLLLYVLSLRKRIGAIKDT